MTVANIKQLIPTQTIGFLADIFPQHYSHAELDALFLRSDAPAASNYPFNNKSEKVNGWLVTTNDTSDVPLEVLGAMIEDYIEKAKPTDCVYPKGFSGKTHDSNEEALACFQRDLDKILKSLSKGGLQYVSGKILQGGASPTRSLQEQVNQGNLEAVDIEIRRALDNVEKDPLAAVHNAGSVLEAALKAYLNHHGVTYKEDADTLSGLWQKVVDHIGLHPKEMDDKDLKKIASGLNSIVDGTMHLRNKKSGAHGKSEEQLKAINIRPRHARLAIHAAHTVSAYVLELMTTTPAAQKKVS